MRLRELRRRAGNPSYRTLAKRAHYSSTTLSDAARGARRAVADGAVTLAYVAACGADTDEWRARWHLCHQQMSNGGASQANGQPPGSEANAVPRPP